MSTLAAVVLHYPFFKFFCKTGIMAFGMSLGLYNINVEEIHVELDIMQPSLLVTLEAKNFYLSWRAEP